MKKSDFPAFFEGIHGYPPFPWQTRLLEEIVETGEWPRTLSLPTAAGKTAAIDIALFHLALESLMEPAQRKAPLRIFFVIDRRIVVDEAFQRAKKMAAVLRSARSGGNGIVGEVARRLADLGGEDEPLQVSILRGGLFRERAWVRTPVQPSICVSTVDQVGSRLLFRGYGVSEFQRPIQAALVGVDSLIILDEAHLSLPFLETLEAVQMFQSPKWYGNGFSKPLKFVRMSATPGREDRPFTLGSDDEDHPVLSKRLRNKKWTRLIEVESEKDQERNNRERLCQEVAVRAREMTRSEDKELPPRVVGVVMNRVASARRVWEILKTNADLDVILLTGRCRPWDRDRLLEQWYPFLQAGRPSGKNPTRPLVVAATQTIEVGANIDFDALVTEIAPFDSLRQRFGRLDRLGRLEESSAVIVGRKDQINVKFDDPIYGTAPGVTWKFLKESPGKGKAGKPFDFGLAGGAFGKKNADEQEKLLAPKVRGAVLLPAHLDTLVQTSPAPVPDVDLGFFLHGPSGVPGDAQVVWRGDLPDELLEQDFSDYLFAISLIPPTSSETLPMPAWALRSWLENRRNSDEIADLEGAPEDWSRPRESSRKVIVWRGIDQSQLVSPSEIRPGDTIVIPASWGGCDEFGWNPGSTVPVQDIADSCELRVRRWPFLRIHPGVLRQWVTNPEVLGELDRLSREILEDPDPGKIRQTMEKILTESLPEGALMLDLQRGLKAILREKVRLIPYPETIGPGFAVSGTKRLARDSVGIGESDSESHLEESGFAPDEETSACTTSVSLSTHSRGVASLAAAFATRSGIPIDLRGVVEKAGLLHDLGKADRRFQVLLHGGDEVAAMSALEPLAKSRLDRRNLDSLRISRKVANLPSGFRHECSSVALLRSQSEGEPESDGLLEFLVGTHHGRGRPFFPVVEDTNPPPIQVFLEGKKHEAVGASRLAELDSGWTEEFWRQVDRHGPWGLAFLEALVRMADHLRSEVEWEGGNG